MTASFDPTQILQGSLRALGCGGVLLAVSENGCIRTYSAGSIAKEEHNRPYYIYSISKSFTAVAVMKLCEERGSFLDASCARLLPERELPEEITVRQLLQHTSGLSDYFSSAAYQQAVQEDPLRPWSYEKLMACGLRATPLFEAGKGWSYSNPGYALLDELVAKQSGMEAYGYVKEVIIERIGLEHTRPFLEVDRDLELLAGEDDAFAGDFRALYQPGWIAPASYIATATDVAKFYDALFGGGLLSEASLAEMMKTVDVLASSGRGAVPAYGLGLMHFRNAPLGDAYGHGGGGPGYTTYALHYPNLEGNCVSLSLVLNKSLPQTPFGLADELVRHYIETHDASSCTSRN